MEGRGMKSARSFARQEPRKIRNNVLIISCTLLSLCILSLLKARYCPATYVKSQISMKLEVPRQADVKMVTDISGENSDQLEDEDDEVNNVGKTSKPICYESSKRSDTCEAEGDIRVRGNSKTILINPSNQEWKIKPYARKGTMSALTHVKEWSLKPFPNNQSPPNCTNHHTVPAVVFSTGGFTGNFFHDFTDVLVPLFISSHQFHKQVQFLVSDTKSWWINKYISLLKQLSDYEIIDTDSDDESTVRCFPKVIAGPSFHKELGVDSSKTWGYSMVDFRVVLKNAFGLERSNAMTSLVEGGLRRPRLLIMSRKNSRVIVNERGMVSMATTLGFDVRVGEPEMSGEVAKFARLVNWADVLIGVHGAGLTNMVFLPAGAVVIQVIPFGGLEWLARGSYKEAAKDMELKYLEYKIGVDESTLIEQYPKEHPVLRDPSTVHKQGWPALKEVYLDKQNVRPHLGRLRNTLMEALKLLPQNGS